MTTSLVMKWLYWNFALSATDEVINYKRSSAIFWNLFCDFEGICAILSGLSDEALTITIPLIGRCSRSFSNVSTTIFLQPSKNLLWLGVGGGGGGGQCWDFNNIICGSPYINKAFFKLVALNFWEILCSSLFRLSNFFFLQKQPRQLIKGHTNFFKQEWMK